MKYIILDIKGKHLERKDFINQPKRLFVLPDNLPDFRLPRDKLHTSNARGGLASCMRPNQIGVRKDTGTGQAMPIYDVNIVGVPTISFHSTEPLQKKHIEEAFVQIYRLVKANKFEELVVPFKDGKPAFGGGVAGRIPAEIETTLQQEFERLQQFLNQVITLEALPEIYQRAYREEMRSASIQSSKQGLPPTSAFFKLTLAQKSLLMGSIVTCAAWLMGFTLLCAFLGGAVASYVGFKLLPVQQVEVAPGLSSAPTISAPIQPGENVSSNTFTPHFKADDVLGDPSTSSSVQNVPLRSSTQRSKP